MSCSSYSENGEYIAQLHSREVPGLLNLYETESRCKRIEQTFVNN